MPGLSNKNKSEVQKIYDLLTDATNITNSTKEIDNYSKGVILDRLSNAMNFIERSFNVFKNEEFSNRIKKCFSLMGYKFDVELLDDKYHTIKSLSIYTEADSEKEAKSQMIDKLDEKYGDKYKIVDVEYPKSSSSCDKHILDL